MNGSERRTWWRELIINNSLYVFLVAAVVVIQFISPNFLSGPSIVNIISLSAANLPIALGIAGAIIPIRSGYRPTARRRWTTPPTMW